MRVQNPLVFYQILASSKRSETQKILTAWLFDKPGFKKSLKSLKALTTDDNWRRVKCDLRKCKYVTIEDDYLIESEEFVKLCHNSLQESEDPVPSTHQLSIVKCVPANSVETYARQISDIITKNQMWEPYSLCKQIAQLSQPDTYGEFCEAVQQTSFLKSVKFFGMYSTQDYGNQSELTQYMQSTIQDLAQPQEVNSVEDSTWKRSSKMHEYRCCLNSGWHRIYQLPEWIEKYGEKTPELEEKFSNIEDPEVKLWWEKVAHQHSHISKYLNDPERYIPPSKAERDALADKIADEYM